LKEPLSPDAATTLVRRITREGKVAFSQHAIHEMQADKLTIVDCVNVLRAGAVRQPADLEKGTWRYRVQTNRMTVVIAFRSDENDTSKADELVIVTAWRQEKR
jgi:hypothetical protein